jgi:hypothetical protein
MYSLIVPFIVGVCGAGLVVWLCFRGSAQHDPLDVQPVRVELERSGVSVVSPAPRPAPEPSCFVKGIIRSMKETPEHWRLSDRYCLYYANLDPIRTADQVTHVPPDLALSLNLHGDEHGKVWCWDIDGHYTTYEEKDAIKKQIRQSFILPLEREKEAKAAAQRASFEQLGCPATE